ncbi:hypothetical protein [Allobranchiibius sp. GilTou38]|uniref:hypothetical protein n=1 Tax=Allobranchiibius sp. GilTou38 TaxID=2815210 RepID=UPI001AA0CCF2|nr:hypothetical protein [Allobranchiibius sp. GilTou38]MBO1766450.1 hypothetical protein [Allobranchiibius sp. GilTou38]
MALLINIDWDGSVRNTRVRVRGVLGSGHDHRVVVSSESFLMVDDDPGRDSRAGGQRYDVVGHGPLMKERVGHGAAARGSQQRRRRRVTALLAGVVVVVLVVAGVVVGVVNGRYGPVEDGGVSGPESLRGLVFSKDGFSFRLASTPGASAQMVAVLQDDGSRAVKVSSVDADRGVTQVRWSVLHRVPGGNAFGINTPWRSFPATIPADGGIRLQLTLGRPADCGAHTQDGHEAYDGSVRVHWRSLLSEHTTTITVLAQPVTIC